MDTKKTSPGRIGKKKLLIIVGAIILVMSVIAAVLFFATPQRSVASYCKIYKEENGKLSTANGTSYGVKVFNHRSSNPTDFVNAFTKLEQVAPDEIRADVKTLRQVFQKINDDPSQAISASLSGISAEASVTDWTKQNCTPTQ